MLPNMISHWNVADSDSDIDEEPIFQLPKPGLIPQTVCMKKRTAVCILVDIRGL